MKITIRATSESEFLRWVNAQNRRASRLGLSPVAVSKVGSRAVETPVAVVEDHEVRELPARLIEVFDYEVISAPVSVSGWTFAALCETTENGNILYGSPDSVSAIPEKFRNSGSVCEHCNTNRVRKNTYIVVHGDGTYKQVGSTCVADFLGTNKIEAWEFSGLILIHFKDWESEDWGRSVSRSFAYDIKSILMLGIRYLENHAFVSRKTALEAGTLSTSDCIGSIIRGDKDAVSDLVITDPANMARWSDEADKIIDWMKSGSGNGYRDNLKTLALNGYCSDRGIGLAVSAIPSYRRSIEEAAAKEKAAKSVHVGEVGKRIEIEVTCESVIAKEGDYGTTGIHKLVDASGNCLVWFASGSTEWLDVGETAKVKASIKSHGEFRGVKQTVLSRVKRV